MTIIAYRNGVMASDTGSWMGDAAHPWARKLARGPDGTLYGVSGNAAESAAFLSWVREGCDGEWPGPREKPDDRSSFIVLIAKPTGEVSLLSASGVEEMYQASYMACGAGSEAALGAMFVGASAEDAIRAALAHSSGVHGEVRCIRHEGD